MSSRLARLLRPAAVLVTAFALVATMASGCGGSPASGPTTTTHGMPEPATNSRPNIVWVLTDDLSNNLVQYMPHLQALMARGMSFSNFSVVDSLCCPSRAAMLTGQYPHDTHVTTNVAPDGGWAGWVKYNDQRKGFAITMANAGYRTGFEGKYLNGYPPPDYPQNPPGWDFWGGVGEGGYQGYNYNMSVNGRLLHYGDRPQDYMTTVLQNYGDQFIKASQTDARPFMLEVSTFAPHHPATPAPQDVNSFPTLTAPHGPTWDKLPTNAPSWEQPHKPLTRADIARCNKSFKLRVEDVQAVDRMLGNLQQTLGRLGELNNTIFMFSSDNGFHIGDYRLLPGKMTAFDTDVNVPLVVAGPGIAASSVNDDSVESIDLAPTFDSIAGAAIPTFVEGHDFLPLLHGQNIPWRTFAGIEHTFPGHHADDPDEQSIGAGRLPSYTALRTKTFTYVHYKNGEREYYDRATDPNMLDNIYNTLSPQRIASLNLHVQALRNCHNYTQCWAAGVPTGG